VNYQCTFTPNGEEFNIRASSSNEAFTKCAKEAGSIEWTMVSIREVSTFWQGDTQEYFKSQLEKFGDGEKAGDFNARSDGSVISTGSPQSSGWATLYRVCGGIILVVGFIGAIAGAQKDEEAGFQLAVMAIALTLTSFLFAFLIDVLTDMRHYLKKIAEKQ